MKSLLSDLCMTVMAILQFGGILILAVVILGIVGSIVSYIRERWFVKPTIGPKVDLDVIAALFQKVQESFPNLKMTLKRDDPNVELLMDIPEQPGLRFNVSINLQSDELHLNAGNFWVVWFPCYKQERVDAFMDAVTGLLSGKFRILETYRGAKNIKSKLQRLNNNDWETIAIGRQSINCWPFPRKFTSKILWNS